MSDNDQDKAGPSSLYQAFCHAMDRLLPFESSPTLAVALSGGGDSLALTLLADRWAKDRKGRVIGLTVDHQLRPASSDEAQQVAQWLKARGMDHHILTWDGPKPTSALQQRARTKRYQLLQDYCRDHGILHLLLAHQQDDQIETVLMRADKQSGPHGLAGMSSLIEQGSVRLLRPLLGLEGAALRNFLQQQNQPWIDDPSNRDPRFERVRIRQALAPEDQRHALELADQSAKLRQDLEQRCQALAAQFITLSQFGFATLAPEALLSPDQDALDHLLARTCLCLGGGDYAPKREQISMLRTALQSRQAMTLAGCQWLFRKSQIFIVPEPRNSTEQIIPIAGKNLSWCDRFRVRIADDISVKPGTFIQALGEIGRLELKKHINANENMLIHQVLEVLPALFDKDGVCEVAQLGYKRNADGFQRPVITDVLFEPKNPLIAQRFHLA